MYERLNKAIEGVKQAVSGLDPDVLEPGHAAELVGDFSEMERVCAAGKTLAASQELEGTCSGNE